MRGFMTAVLLVVSSNLFAGIITPWPQDLLPKEKNTTSAPCTDFSGSWKGTCSISGGSSMEITRKVNQFGCEYIGGAEMMFGIGGLMTLSSTSLVPNSPTADASTATISIDWNKDRTQLNSKAGYVMKNVGSKSGESIVHHVTALSNMKLVGGKLVETTTTSEQKTYTCELSKQ
jgi:hypothetical protein